MERQTASYPATDKATARMRKRLMFGTEVRVFCAVHGIRQTELAERTGISYTSLRDTVQGRMAGHELVPIVRAYMDSKNKALLDGKEE